MIELVEGSTDDAQLLVAELDAELSKPYAPEQRHGLSLAAIFRPNIRFFIARMGDEPVGCAGIAFEDDFAEVKRMYVRPMARGQGVADSLLARLEAEARERLPAVSRLTLETGDERLAAIRFYERAGFTRCGAFGAYAGMKPNAIVHSVFFEKTIA